MLGHLWEHRKLTLRMVLRDVTSRYKGSVLGLAWSFFYPVLLLVVYTFVFTVVFKARWGVDADQSKGAFALQLFAGIIVHGVLAEILNRAPVIVLQHTSYVKRVVFPLEVLPLIPLGSSIFNAGVSLIALVIAQVLLTGVISPLLWLAPVVLLPLTVFTMGVGWMLASLGVYLRDISHTMGLLATILLFLSPIFYPLSALPEKYHPIILLNPLTFILEQFRAVVIEGTWPNWTGLSIYTVLAVLVAWAGFAWFQKTRKGFADVL